DVGRDLLASVYNLLVQDDGPVQFLKEEHSVSFHDQEAALSWEMIFDRCSEFRARYAIPSDEFIILLTSKRNKENWFASQDPKGTQSVFIHTSEWNNYLDCDPCYPVAFECWVNLLHALMFRSWKEAVEVIHDPSIGCPTITRRTFGRIWSGRPTQ